MNEKRKRIPSISIESQELIRRLERAQLGEIVAYDELSQLAMGSVQHEKRFALKTAEEHLLSEKNWVFEAVVNVGVKRLNDVEIVKTGEAAIAKTHRASRRALKKLSCVDFDKLPKNQQIDHNVRFSILGALDHITKPKQVKQIEAAVIKMDHRLMLQETLDAFDRKEQDATIFPFIKKTG